MGTLSNHISFCFQVLFSGDYYVNIFTRLMLKIYYVQYDNTLLHEYFQGDQGPAGKDGQHGESGKPVC